jgi:predicted Zn-ribbon and HTH transcriptional regulator
MKKESKKLDRCPKCGGDSGYFLVERLRLSVAWDGEAQDTHSLGTNKTAECRDCGYKFKADRAT